MKSFKWVIFGILFTSLFLSCFDTKEEEALSAENLILISALTTPKTSGPTSFQFSTTGAGNTAHVGLKNSTIYIGVPNNSVANITITPTGFTHNFVGTGRISMESSISPLTLTSSIYAKDFERGTITGTAPGAVSTVNSKLIYTTSLSGGTVTNPQVTFPVVIKYDSNVNLLKSKCKSAVGSGCTSLTPYTCDDSSFCTANAECSSLSECVYTQ
ncbi:hypothetical protein [Leptospira jelokensis]|uniref:hypothetical protein n=1 Tax=Leptospira jelokensis TaxID=2484931 RepID=UPI001091511D|nr:hypothetical protein [Leptospira jelokensis]TGM06267.1 hypothetical protein EHQ79_01670 [Leptospira jelokensis]